MMTLTPTWFRRLIMLSIAAAIAAAVIGEGSVSPTLKLAYEAEPNPWFEHHLWLVLALFIPYVAISIAGMVGLYRFRLWGRSIALWSSVVGFALGPFFGADLSSPVGTILSEMSHMSWGAVLALAYFSPLSSEFKDAPSTPQAIASVPPSA
jgi:hypothetical protein